MALLRKTKKTEAAAPKKKKTVTEGSVSVSSVVNNLRQVILRPRVTEKATLQNILNVYVFEVEKNATKKTVASAIKSLYKVTPRKVSIVPVRRKATFVRGKKGHSAGGRKAYVYLRKEDKIEIV